MKRSFIKPITLFGDDQPIEKVSDLLSIKASKIASELDGIQTEVGRSKRFKKKLLVTCSKTLR